MLIDLSWNSSRLEGNTYSLLDTKRLIELGDPAASRDIRETQMILNHTHAIEFLVESVDDVGIDRRTILNLHAILAENLLPDPAAPGRLRTIPVGIGAPAYRPPEVPAQVEECFNRVQPRLRRSIPRSNRAVLPRSDIRARRPIRRCRMSKRSTTSARESRASGAGRA